MTYIPPLTKLFWLFYIVFALALLSVSLKASAVIIDGTFHGTVLIASDNGDGNPPSPFYNDAWSDDIIGKQITGHFSYDTNLIAANSGTNGQIRESYTDNWLHLSFDLGGQSVDISTLPDGFSPTHIYEKLNIDDALGYTMIRDFTQDHFSLWKEVYSASADGQFNQAVFGGVSFLYQIVPALSGNTLIQEFSWTDAGGEFDVLDDVPGLFYLGVDGKPNDKLSQGTIIGRISDIQLWARDAVTVPEPSPAWLLIAGIGLLRLRRCQ